MKTVNRNGTMLVVAALLLCLLTHTAVLAAGKLELGIDDVITAALQHNLDLKVERIAPQVSEQAVVAEESVFDSVFSAETSGTGNSVDYEDASTDTTGYEVGAAVSKKFEPGTDVALSLDYSEDSADDTEAGGDGTSAQAALTVTQPLLRNRGRDVNRRNVTIAENDLGVARLSLKQAVIDTVSEAQELYWQYYYAVAYLDVQQKSLELARESMKEMEEKIVIGSSPKLDLLSSRAEVASREENVIAAENDVYNSRDELLNYIYGTISGNREVICTDAPTFEEVEVDEQMLTQYALEHRTDYLSQRYEVNSAETNVRYYDNQRLPQLDLSGILGVNDGSADDRAITQFQADDYHDYSYGALTLSLEYPFGLRRDNANHASALLKKRQAVIEKEQVRSRIELEVRTALRDMQSTRKRYQAARLASRYAEESLKTEQEKFANGLSTSYQLLLYQRDLADAQATEVEAMVLFQTSVIQLYSTSGSTLEKHNIQLDGEKS